MSPRSSAALPLAEVTVRCASHGESSFRDALPHPVAYADSGDLVQWADFSTPTTRGTAVDLGPEFPGFKHEVCHVDGAWHDAGDYGRYVVNSGISTGALPWSWEMFSAKLRSVKLHPPETGNGTPGLLDEIRWSLEWTLGMQDEDSGVTGSDAEAFRTSRASGDFAAVMAIAGRAYQPFDAAFAGKCLHASRQAWTWLGRFPNVTFRNPERGSTGAYGAAAERWRTTGDDEYQKHFLEQYAGFRNSIRAAGPQSCANVANLALWTCVLGGGRDAAAVAANYGMQLPVANSFDSKPPFGETAFDANPLGLPHHRPSGADASPEPWPGPTAGGPNCGRQDNAMRCIPADTPPAKCYLDDQEAYSANEVAINWNAPLVFLLAGALAAK
jgi:endoglucanase